MTVAGPKAN